MRQEIAFRHALGRPRPTLAKNMPAPVCVIDKKSLFGLHRPAQVESMPKAI
jgi:hypothetical protein